MKRIHLKYYGYFLFGLLLISCAQINPLLGGEKDVFAPSIDSAGTYPQNGQTNFTGNEIIIKFQEYIALNNPNDNIIITPQLKNKPEISVKNKKLKIFFTDTLQENTTYTISFNHAITDITEKNDSIFQYVFSTGDYIDSLTLKGKITDAFNNKGAEGYLVGLYNANSTFQYDSIPFNERPIYIAQSDRTGNFNMNYLKAGDYVIFAIEDQNRNLRLEPLERRAFLLMDTLTIAAKNKNVILRAFRPDVGESKLTTTKFQYPGRLEFIFNNPPEKFEVSSDLMAINQEETGVKDSLVYWLEGKPQGRMEFIVNVNGEIDTIKPLFKGAPEKGASKVLILTNNLKGGNLLPNAQFTLISPEPYDQVLEDHIHFMDKDSVELDPVTYTIENGRSLIFDTLDPQVNFIKLDSLVATSKFGNSVEADQWIKLKLLEADYFGSLIINIDTLFDQPVFVELLNEENDVVVLKSFQQKLVFEELIPGKYQIRLIFDDNDDEKWTTGSLKERRLPERVIYNRELIDVKSRWEKEVDWIIEN
ncbi:MAG: hypothetical protein GQ574_27640 [Crocinitomix sp.]|nr:hypothetical protein [Crocinitomix sp.]